MFAVRLSFCAAVLSVVVAEEVNFGCPAAGVMPISHPSVIGLTRPTPHPDYVEALNELDVDALKADLKALATDSQDFWPADYGNYVGLFVRFAWHCAGSYRLSDGLGGCDGSRIRFDPERSWEDNTNLDKARRILFPIKEKYGLGLSWGDLIVLAADVAMENAGFQTLGTCMGRVDEYSGFWSHELGPNNEQEAVAPCAEANGDCQAPFGATTRQLIYVNPGGPFGNFSDLLGSAAQSRSTFSRMGMNDSETVALIGGGHAFGKAHGACPNGAGPPPREQPWNSWPGLCGTGLGDDTFTSGFEGPWTSTPDTWSNLYFQYLRDNEFEPFTGPSGNVYYQIKGNPSLEQAPKAHDPTQMQNIMMLASDVALTEDELYKPIVLKYADDIAALENSFAAAWYKLMSRDMGPHSRCLGPLTPPPQPWQYPIPEPDYELTEDQIASAKETLMSELLTSNEVAMTYVTLAAQCAATHRVTDYRGGCNGARIRFSPEIDLPSNAGLKEPLDALVSATNGLMSAADAIVLTGITAIEKLSGLKLPFCSGRGDATDGEGSSDLNTWITREYTESTDEIASFLHSIKISGLTITEAVAFMAKDRLSIEYYKDILYNEWTSTGNGGDQAFMSNGLYASQSDIFLTYVPELRVVAERFANGSEGQWATIFAQAWTKMMNADLFDGPTANKCDSMFIEEDACNKDTEGYFCSPSSQCMCYASGARSVLFGPTPTGCSCKSLYAEA